MESAQLEILSCTENVGFLHCSYLPFITKMLTSVAYRTAVTWHENMTVLVLCISRAVIPSHTWQFMPKLVKAKSTRNSHVQGHQSHFKAEMHTSLVAVIPHTAQAERDL